MRSKDKERLFMQIHIFINIINPLTREELICLTLVPNSLIIRYSRFFIRITFNAPIHLRLLKINSTMFYIFEIDLSPLTFNFKNIHVFGIYRVEVFLYLRIVFHFLRSIKTMQSLNRSSLYNRTLLER